MTAATMRTKCPKMMRLRKASVLCAFVIVASLLAPASALANTNGPPDTPASVSVTRADGTLTASWPAADRATGYHITYSSDNKQSWSLAAYNHSDTSITINKVSNEATYVVAVRALNSNGGSGWRNSAPAGPWVRPDPPATPSSVSVLRADGSMTASWPAADRATGYHITYSSDSKQSWSLAAYNHSDTSITIGGVSNEATYVVAVRALSIGGGGASGWRNSAPSEPYTWTGPPATPSSVSVLRADGSLTASWPAAGGATGYHITYSSDGKYSWSLGAYNHSDTSITIGGVSNDATYIVAVRALNDSGWSGWRHSPSASEWVSPGTVENLRVSQIGNDFDISWDALPRATGYDIRAKAQSSDTWHGVAADIAQTSYSYTPNVTISHIAVRGRNAGNAGRWNEFVLATS